MKFIARRLGFYLIAFWIAVTLNFALPRLMPGNPADTLFASYGGRMTPDQLKALRSALGFTNQNVFQQYLTYLWNLAHGQLGLSYAHYPVPVADVIRNDIGWTLLLVGIAVAISFTFSRAVSVSGSQLRAHWQSSRQCYSPMSPSPCSTSPFVWGF